MGPSGTGKTTLLRMITGQLRPAAGRVVVDEHDVPGLTRAGVFELRKSMGMLFQNSALLTDYTVFENVAFPVREHTRLPERLVRTLVLTKLHAVGLRGAAQLMPAQLSGGMARRVALARAMVLDPELLLYDEPFSGLDPISMGMVLRLIKVNNDVLGVTSVVVSHAVEDITPALRPRESVVVETPTRSNRPPMANLPEYTPMEPVMVVGSAQIASAPVAT